jgi:hypothetical protein
MTCMINMFCCSNLKIKFYLMDKIHLKNNFFSRRIEILGNLEVWGPKVYSGASFCGAFCHRDKFTFCGGSVGDVVAQLSM